MRAPLFHFGIVTEIYARARKQFIQTMRAFFYKTLFSIQKYVILPAARSSPAEALNFICFDFFIDLMPAFSRSVHAKEKIICGKNHSCKILFMKFQTFWCVLLFVSHTLYWVLIRCAPVSATTQMPIYTALMHAAGVWYAALLLCNVCRGANNIPAEANLKGLFWWVAAAQARVSRRFIVCFNKIWILGVGFCGLLYDTFCGCWRTFAYMFMYFRLCFLCNWRVILWMLCVVYA